MDLVEEFILDTLMTLLYCLEVQIDKLKTWLID